jgi:cell division protein FtsW (lipid II flippase)
VPRSVTGTGVATGVGAFEAEAAAALLDDAADVAAALVVAAAVLLVAALAVVAAALLVAALVLAALVLAALVLAALLVAALLAGAALLAALVVTVVAADPPQAASDSPASAPDARIRKLRREDVFNAILSSASGAGEDPTAAGLCSLVIVRACAPSRAHSSL